MQHERFINLTELRERLGGISPASAYRYIQQIDGFPQPIKLGHATRFRESEVDAFICGADNSSKGGESQ
jgi:predicted DNA-binding transcriptional regulator AlpA